MREKWMIINEEWIDNDIGAEGIKLISESRKINTSLTMLDLDGNKELKMKSIN